MRAIEREIGLRQVESWAQTERRAVAKGEIEERLGTGQPSTRQQLQQLCDAAASNFGTFLHCAERVEAGAGGSVLANGHFGTILLSKSSRMSHRRN